jgi:3-methyladenine DNA glycosylase AlkD
MRALMNPAKAVAWLEKRFRDDGNSVRAAKERAYLKSELRFHGVTASQLKQAVAELDRAQPEIDLRATVDALYATDWFDLRSAGIALLDRRVDELRAADADWLLALARRSGNWAQVDWLATRILGPVVEAHPKLEAKLRRWARDSDFWVRRTALLALLLPLRRGGGNFALFAELAAPMLEEKEFFIRKAIGWVLREVAKKRPELTHGFLRQHRAKMSGLTFREGSRRLPARLRDSL